MRLEHIYSASACLALADQLQKQAESLRRHAKNLDHKRNYISIGQSERPAIVKAGNYLKSLPEFHRLPATEWRKISQRFFVPEAEFMKYARVICARERRKIAADKARAAHKMHSKGYTQKQIAERLGLSPARINQIINPDKDAAAAKAVGMTPKRYRAAKAQGIIK